LHLRIKNPTTGVFGWIIVLIFVVFAAALLVPGIALFELHSTGTPARATIDECVTTGISKYQRTDCSGTWIVGGSLFDGGHVIVGSIEGDLSEADDGKTIDVLLHGDTAYTRSLTTPLVLIGMGAFPAIAAVAFAVLVIRRR
jgi:hypothetical protein